MTIAVAARATVTPCPPSRPAPSAPPASARATRGAREEDHALGGARYLLEGAHHLRLPPAGLRDHRHRGPHAVLQLAPELLHQPLLVLGDLDVALGEHLLTVARTHAEELHDPIMPRGEGP